MAIIIYCCYVVVYVVKKFISDNSWLISGNSCLNKKNIYGHSRSFMVIHVQNLLLASERDLVDFTPLYINVS